MFSFCTGFQVVEVSVPQDQTAPVPVGNGQQTFRADKHTVGRCCRCSLCPVVLITTDDASDFTAGTRNSGTEENASYTHVPGFVLPRRHQEPHNEILKISGDTLSHIQYLYIYSYIYIYKYYIKVEYFTKNGRRSRYTRLVSVDI